MGSQHRHDGLVKRLSGLLVPAPTWRFIEYNRSDHWLQDILESNRTVYCPLGEIDLLRYNDGWEFYEVKCNKKNRLKANKQWKRFKEQFHDNVQGYFYCPEGLYPFR